jgi:hypothetical protein
MSKVTLARLWIVTGLVALLLTAATIGLATRARHMSMQNKQAFVTSPNGPIHLYEQPDRASPVLITLVNGSSVMVIDFATRNGRTWYYVKRSGTNPGWVQARNITLDHS